MRGESSGPSNRVLWVGSYPPAGIGTPPGRGEGVYRVELAPDGSLTVPVRAAPAPAPSFVVPAGPVLYAVGEDEPGSVMAFAVRGEGLEPLGTVWSGGDLPCHLHVDGDRLYVANYGDGALGVVPLAKDGRFAAGEPAQVHAHAGSGPRGDRQAGPHAHFVVPAPGGHVLVVDLGTDEVRRYARVTGGLSARGVAASFPPGTGPRHLAFSPDGRRAYLTGELTSTVHVLAWDPATDTGDLLQTVPATAPARGQAAGGGPDRTPAPSHLLLTGRELVVGVRGAGVLSRFAVGADGLLTHRADHRLPTPVPRHVAVVGGWTVVAEQVPGAVTVLGPGGTVVASRPVPSASCIAAA